jgi:hypothetical protein
MFHLNNEKRLIDDLFKNYQVKFGRPVNNMTEKVIVNFEVFLVQIIDLDEREQVLITNVETQYVNNKFNMYIQRPLVNPDKIMWPKIESGLSKI